MAKGTCYIFLGPELGEKENAIAEVRKKLSGKGPPPEEASFYAGETPVTDIVSVLRNGSLFAESRLFFIKNADALTAENSKKKADLDLLISCIEAPHEDTALIFLSEETRISDRIEKAVPASSKEVFWELDEGRKIAWVNNFFRQEGCRIESDAVETILEMVENNTGALGRECSRLLSFLGKDKTIGAAEVEQWLSHSREESAFTLFARIARGELTKSLESLHALLGAKEAPPRILAMLAGCFRKLRDYLALTEGGPPDEFEFKKIGLGSRTIRKDYTEAARRYAAAAPCLALIAEYDVRTRAAGTAAEILLMDYFIYKLFSLQVRPRYG